MDLKGEGYVIPLEKIFLKISFIQNKFMKLAKNNLKIIIFRLLKLFENLLEKFCGQICFQRKKNLSDLPTLFFITDKKSKIS